MKVTSEHMRQAAEVVSGYRTMTTKKADMTYRALNILALVVTAIVVLPSDPPVGLLHCSFFLLMAAAGLESGPILGTAAYLWLVAAMAVSIFL